MCFLLALLVWVLVLEFNTKEAVPCIGNHAKSAQRNRGAGGTSLLPAGQDERLRPGTQNLCFTISSKWFQIYLVLSWNTYHMINQGLRHDQVDTKFWRRRGVAFSEDDVVLRTSRVDPFRIACLIFVFKAQLSFKDKAIPIRRLLVSEDFPVFAHQRC